MPRTPLETLETLEKRWESTLASTRWYLTVIPELQTFTESLRNQSEEARSECKKAHYDFFERHLVANDFLLGHGTGAFDSERKPIDTIVIHHTSNPPGLSSSRLSAIELMRLYAPYFVKPETKDAHLRGEPLVSGHVRNGRQVFWPYHWIIRNDGRAERLLLDPEIGWHAGNWNINCRSVAIVFDDDCEWKTPSRLMIRSVATLVARHYPQVPLDRIFGHREVNANTTCPSNLFLSNN
jgi:hypothetical protein